MSNQDYLVLKGHYTASMCTAGEAEDVLTFLPGQVDQLVLRLQYAGGAGVVELRLLPEDQPFIEKVVAGIRGIALVRAAKAEKALKSLPAPTK